MVGLRADCTALQDMTAVLSNCCSGTMSFNPITAANIGKALARIAEAEGLPEDPALVKVAPSLHLLPWHSVIFS